MSLTKDSQHTRIGEIKTCAETIFTGTPEEIAHRYQVFASGAFVWPNGSLRKPSGQYIRRLLDQGHKPRQIPSQLVDDLVPLLTSKNIGVLVERIASSEQGRRWLIEQYFTETLESLGNQQLSVISLDLIGCVFAEASSPEERAEILSLGLGKEQLYDGLVSYSLNKK